MCDHEPGLLTRIIPAMVAPRKASSDRRRCAPPRLLSVETSTSETPSRLRARAEAELFWVGQDRGLVVVAHRLFERLALVEPLLDGAVVAGRHAVQPVGAVLGEPTLAVGRAQ